MTPRPTILVVDDDPDLRESIVDVLTDGGYEALSAEHGRAALDLLLRSATLPAAIILDIMMPVMNGLAFADEMHKHGRLAAIPIIIFSAHSEHERVAAAVHAVASLNKPLKLDHLLAAVKAAVQRGNGGQPPRATTPSH